MPLQTNTLLLPTSGGVQMIALDGIIRIEASSNYCKLFFAGGKTLVVAKVLRWFEARLSGSGFLRPHRTHLVNSAYISRYVKGPNSHIVLRSGERVDISKRKRTDFLKSWRAAA